MEIVIFLNILRPGYGTQSFELTSLTWDMNKNLGTVWKKSDEDKSFLALGHIMEKAFLLNKLTFSYHDSPDLTVELMMSQRKKNILKGTIGCFVKNSSTNGFIWKVNYSFSFQVQVVDTNIKPTTGGKPFNYAVVKIIDKTEKREFAN